MKDPVTKLSNEGQPREAEVGADAAIRQGGDPQHVGEVQLGLSRAGRPQSANLPNPPPSPAQSVVGRECQESCGTESSASQISASSGWKACKPWSRGGVGIPTCSANFPLISSTEAITLSKLILGKGPKESDM